MTSHKPIVWESQWSKSIKIVEIEQCFVCLGPPVGCGYFIRLSSDLQYVLSCGLVQGLNILPFVVFNDDICSCICFWVGFHLLWKYLKQWLRSGAYNPMPGSILQFSLNEIIKET
ncbi:hypothetical protein VNO77_21588 [Canavalia gladiata]|uniref:Uncharacterized protein n=1 Tax=Canavalia gladiata TaxID=3824 RepID=A0AAN9LSB4_CANGL